MTPTALLRFALAAIAALAATAAVAAPPPPPANPLEPPEIRAQIQAVQSTVLSAGIAGRLTELPFREGEAVSRGALLAASDCSTQRAGLAQASAEHAAAERVADADRRLLQLGGIGTIELATVIEKEKSTAAQVSYAATMVGRCVVRAPFAGRVGVVQVRRWQSVAEGTPLMDLVNDRALQTVMIVPSRWLAWLRIGTRFSIALDETGGAVQVQVARRGATIDPVSQTVTVYGRILGPASGAAPGMSGVAHFPTAPTGRP